MLPGGGGRSPAIAAPHSPLATATDGHKTRAQPRLTMALCPSMDISILLKPGRVPVALHHGYRLGARLSSCGAPLTRTCNGWSADTASGTGQRMLAPGST
ncbi:hypothetical protein PFLmoz3_05260 [Pseudomonas fluorescens]|uniref:Uncharacterized protein n=1 Tax=Pseudomonas fluorescens TaxID=294 RepID=A0A109LC70_PSEFL|nr:hypothetical protein PFLmoz3_05260 [Pseudomonas fluorescens]